MKKVSILSCSTGQGHNSCAQAIKEYFENKGVYCEITDSLSFISDRFAHFMSWGHSFMYCHIPSLFKWGYSYTMKHSAVFEKGSLVYSLLTSGKERLYEYISEGDFDTVICTHVFSAIMLSDMINDYPINLLSCFTATDYTTYPGMSSCNADIYFLPSANVKKPYLKSGISPDKIMCSGIPVNQSFFTTFDKKEAAKLLGINESVPHLLIMCGSMGCGPVKSVIKHLIKAAKASMQITVICGRNKRLKKVLSRKTRNMNNFNIIGYTDKVSLYMDSADLYLTKPGGISVSEAAVKKLPMVFINAVAGCELYNFNHFKAIGAAFSADTPKELAEICIRLLESPEQLKQMKTAFEKYPVQNGAENIYHKIRGDI